MKVLHVIPAVAARYGGPSSTIVSMCRALNVYGIDTLVATTDADGEGRLDVPLGTPCEWNGIRTIFFRRQWSEAFKYSRPLARWLDRHAREFSAVHIHAVLSHAPLAAGRAARRAGVPAIVRPLGTLDAWSIGQKPWRKRLLMKLGARDLLRGASAIQYTSAEEQRQVEDTLRLNHGAVVPLGVDASWLSERPSVDSARAADRYVLALSRLHPVKNLEALIEAFLDARNHSGHEVWRLVIAGSGDEGYASGLRALIAARSAENVVHLTGWIDGAAKRQLMRQASVFSLPSLHENFGVSLVEAMAAGVPVVVSDQVHLAEAVAKAGAGWVARPDRSSLTAALGEAISDANDRHRRATAARQLAESFAWPSIAAELATLYQSVTVNCHLGIDDTRGSDVGLTPV